MPLPPQVHVFVRDWLSANNVLLKSRDGHVLIDSGYVSHAPLTLALLASPRGLGGEPLAQLVNTHGHSDHVGGNAAVQCRVRLPDRVSGGRGAARGAVGREDAALRLRRPGCATLCHRRAAASGSTQVWGELEWRMLAAPGHDMGALVFYNPEHRILVSGDALWENGYGFVMPRAIDPDALPATRATLDMIAGLDVRTVIPGHGEVFTDVARRARASLSPHGSVRSGRRA